VTLLPGNLFHSGFIVDDLEAAVAEMSALGIRRWTTPKRSELPALSPDRSVGTFRVRYVYSVDGPHHFELIEPLPYGVISSVNTATFHHLGFWSDEREKDLKGLLDRGYRLEYDLLRPSDEIAATYLTSNTGPRVELIPSANRDRMQAKWNTFKTSGTP